RDGRAGLRHQVCLRREERIAGQGSRVLAGGRAPGGKGGPVGALQDVEEAADAAGAGGVVVVVVDVGEVGGDSRAYRGCLGGTGAGHGVLEDVVAQVQVGYAVALDNETRALAAGWVGECAVEVDAVEVDFEARAAGEPDTGSGKGEGAAVCLDAVDD